MTASTGPDRATAWLLDELPAVIPPWLQSQRWFGGKARSIGRVDVEDVLRLAVKPWCALVVVDVTYGTGVPGTPPHERYATVVGLYNDPAGRPTIGHLPGQPDRCVVEAATDGPALVALLHGLLSGAPVHGARGGELTYADATNRARQALAPGAEGPPRVVAVGHEQSNTSVRLGSTQVFKLFRRLEEGENPELEIGRFLAGTGFRAAPPLEGSLTYHAPDGRTSTLGVLEGWVASEGDGWSYVVARLEQAARDVSGLDELAQDMFLLGTTTADLHAAMASDESSEAFAPEPVTSWDTGLWRSGLLAQAERAFALVDRHHTEWPEEASALGRALVLTRTDVAHRIRTLDLWPHEPFQKIRIHGDFHLGQTLKTPSGFAVIDFEGEPTKPLAERRQKQCALRDVAGMLRSFQYAIETASGRGRPGARFNPREAFLEGYRARALTGGARFLPANPDALAAWIRFFELQKALYEVEYEVNNRPAWVHIPLRGMAQILAAQ